MRLRLFFASAVGAAIALIPSSANAELLYGLTTSSSLVTFDSASPSQLTSAVFITGLANNEQLIGLDLRPADGNLYSLSSFGQIYRINSNTGVATFMSSVGTTLSGSSYGTDFNPVVDRLRIVSDTTQNLRVNVVTGGATVDTNLAYASGDPNFGITPRIAGIAYTNNFAGAGSTTLYGIDYNNNSLVLINPPNNGTVTTVGFLGISATGVNGFDISQSGVAYAALQTLASPGTKLYTINLATGAATLTGTVDGGGSNVLLVGLAAAPVPEPATIAALGLGAIALIRRRKNR